MKPVFVQLRQVKPFALKLILFLLSLSLVQEVKEYHEEQLKHDDQCDQIVRFLKVVGVKFYYKSSQNIWRLTELFWRGPRLK